MGPRQRELELCRTAEPVVGPELARTNHLGDPHGRHDGADHSRPAHGGPGRRPQARAAGSLRGLRLPLDARLPHLRPVGRRPHRRAPAALPRPHDPLAGKRPRRAVLRIRLTDLPPRRSECGERPASKRPTARRGADCGRLHRTGPRCAPRSRVRRRDVVELRGLRRGHLGEAAARPGGARALLSGSGAPTDRPSRPWPPSHSSSEPSGSSALPTSSGSMSTPTSSPSTRKCSSRVSTAGIEIATGATRREIATAARVRPADVTVVPAGGEGDGSRPRRRRRRSAFGRCVVSDREVARRPRSR